MSGALKRLAFVLCGGLIGLFAVPGFSPAQEVSNAARIYDENEVGHDITNLQQQNSRFRLFGQGDRAVTSLKAVGTTAFGRGMEYFVTNTGIVDAADLNMDSQPDIARSGGRSGQWFDVSPSYGAGREEWVRFLDQVPSLANATGGGYAVSRNFPTLGLRELLASDFEFGTAFSGQQSTDDGGCTDQTSDALSNIAAGNTLLAGSDCPPTWPLVEGTPTFKGSRKISADGFLASQAAEGIEFNFDWWRVDPEQIEASAIFGNFQTYGAYDDFNSSMIGRFGNVVPGGSGDPQDEGWPLGLRTEFDAFTFALPTVANSMFWRAMIINQTEQVYGVGLDYEKLYVGYSMMPIRAQDASFYQEVWRGTIMTAERGTGSPQCPGVAPPNVAFIDCAGDPNGFGLGTDAHIVLKSPIGDLRNVLFTCDPAEAATRAATRSIPCPTGDFFDPGNVHAGDTITFNHFRQCPFGGTCSSETMTGPDRQMFGSLASNTADFLNGRDALSLGANTQYAVFRNPNYPQQPTPFSFWVPGTWDYSANGTGAPDTIFVPTCYGPPGVTIQGTTRENREDACVVTWADTMPVGEQGNPAYNNSEGNISYWSVGPFALGAGDTTALVIAMVAAADSLAIDTEVNNVIDLYMNFYLSPEAPPKVTIVGVDVQVEDPQAGAGRGEVTLFWDDASDEFVDPFLEAFANNLLNAADASPLGQIRGLNCPDPLEDPECETGIVGDILERAQNNLEQILIFKSCDDGATFTTNDTDGRGMLDCDADPAQDIGGSAVGPGWQAYARLPVDANGEAPNSFNDELVIPGHSYTYVVVGESRGAQFPILNGVDLDDPPDGIVDEVFPDSLVLAPSLINPLSTSVSESNVVKVYVPGTNQSGAQLARASIGPDVGRGTGDFEVRFTGSPVVEGSYRAAFGNRFTVTEVLDPGTGVLDTTIVIVEDIVTAEVSPGVSGEAAIQTFLLGTGNPNGVQIAGEPDSVVTVGDTTRTFLSGLGFLLFRLNPDEPLFISTDLDGEDSTPSEVFGRQAVGGFTGFPGFVVDVDNSAAGDFDRQRYLFSAQGDTIPNQILPTLTWDQQNSQRNTAAGVSSYGSYFITWADFTFGPGAPFEVSDAAKRDPAILQQAVTQSLQARAVGQTGRTDAEAAAAIGAAEEDLVPVKVPFSVRNALFDRDVDVAMLSRAAGQNQILLGNTGQGDTLTVQIPEDVWVPGDELIFLETVTLDSTVAAGVVLGSDGRPIQNQRLVATFQPALLSCGNNPRPSCNPVEGQGTTNNWVSTVEGEVLLVIYTAPYLLESQVTFETQRAIVGEEAIAAGLDIASQMDSIRVVPNPYIMFSEYQIATAAQTDARLLFTHLPPRGTLRIFTVSGQFVQEIGWEPSDLAGNGDLFWDMRTKEGNEIGAGLFVFTVQARNPAGGGEVKKIGKFVVIR